MSAQVFYLPFNPIFSSRGLPAGSASASFYISGTTTLASIYANSALSERLPNPIVANALGVLPTIYMDGAVQYRVRIQSVIGELVGDIDPYVPNQVVNAPLYAQAAQRSADAASGFETAAEAQAANALTSATAADLAKSAAMASDTSAGLYAAAAQAFAAGHLFATTDAGVAAVAEGDPFLLQGTYGGPVFAELYRKTGGVAADQGLAVPSLASLGALSNLPSRTDNLEAKLLANTILGGTITPAIGGKIGDAHAYPQPLNPGGGVNASGATGSLTRPIYAATEAGYGAQWVALMGTAVAGRTVKFYIVRAGLIYHVSPAIPAAGKGELKYAVPYLVASTLKSGDSIGIFVSGNTFGIQVFSYGTGPYPINVTRVKQDLLDVNLGDDTSDYPTTNAYFPLLELQYVRLPNVFATQAYVQDVILPLKGKTIVINGDSIASIGQGQPSQGGFSWPYWLGQITGATIVDNALGGTGAYWNPADPTVGLSATQAELTAAGLVAAYSYEVQTLPFDGDVWIFAMGFNDKARPLGSISARPVNANVDTFCASLNRATIYGSYQFMIERRLQAFPGKAIVLATPSSLYAPDGTFDSLSAVDGVMRSLASLYALPLLDFARDGGISSATAHHFYNIDGTWVDPDGDPISAEGTHPSAEWHEKFAGPIAAAAVLATIR